MSNDENIDVEQDLSRREFIEKGAGFIAGLAGMFGLANLGGMIGKQERTRGYGSSSYGGKKKGS